MKKTLLLVAFFSILSSQASHILGGEITWECTGNQSYVFQLVLYADCSQSLPGTTSKNLTWSASPAPIACLFVDSSVVSPSCGNPNYAISCDSAGNFTPVIKYTYQSAPVYLNQIITPAGWYFSYAETGRPLTDNTVGANGYLLRSAMFPYTVNGSQMSPVQCFDSSPQFGEKPRYAFNNDTNAFYLDGSDPDLQDSIAFKWAPAWASGSAVPGTNINYAAGYSFNQPLPGASINSGNSGATLYNHGLLAFKSVTIGRFTTCYLIESFRDGQLISQVFRDFEMQINVDPGAPGICGSNSNNAPQINFNWYAGYDTLVPVMANGVLSHYELVVFAGDTVKFKVTGQDVDLNPNCTPQSIEAKAIGASLSQSNTGSSNCFNAPCANFLSLNPGGSYVSSLSNETQFYWETDTSHASGPLGYGLHRFEFEFSDSYCALPGIGQAPVLIKVLRPIYTLNTNLGLCQGDTVDTEIKGDVSNLSWSPIIGISCTTCANPKFYPTANTTYVVTDLNSGYSINFDIEVDAPVVKPQLVQNGADLMFNNVNDYDTIAWYRNTAPFYPTPTNSHTPWLSGDYWVKGASGYCEAFSDTFTYTVANNLSANNSLGAFSGYSNESRTFGATIRLSNEPYYAIDGILVQSLDNSAQGPNLNALECKIYNDQAVVVFESDSVTRINYEMLKFHGEVNLNSQKDYFVTVYADTSVQIPLFKPNSWPVVANNGRVFVFNAQVANGNNYPINSATEYPYFFFSLKWGIGIGELNENAFQVYPNPTSTVLNIESKNPADYFLMSTSGQMVKKGSVEGRTKVDVSDFPVGVYVLVMQNESGGTSQQRVVIAR